MVASSILERIKKLLALAGNNPNAHERQQAMERAQQFMQEHNLSIQDVDRAVGPSSVEDKDTEIKTVNWKTWVAMASAKLYYCKVYKSQGSLRFIGTSENVQVATSIAMWLIQTIERESKAYSTEAKERSSFCIGAGLALIDRANLLRKQEQEEAAKPAEGSKGYALMVVRNQLESANEDYAKKHLNLKKGTKGRGYSASDDGLNAGKAYGNSINLNKQVSATSGKQITSRG